MSHKLSGAFCFKLSFPGSRKMFVSIYFIQEARMPDFHRNKQILREQPQLIEVCFLHD